MEKIAIISDIHGNLTALNTVLSDIEARGISKIYCLGDIIVKCPEPAEVVDILKEKCEVILKGNCDEAISRPSIEPGKFWSRDKIGEERANYIHHLPVSTEFYISGYLVRLFHASPFSLEHIFNPMYSNIDTPYYNKLINNPEDMFLNTEFLGKTQSDLTPDIIGYGHLHTPNIFRFKNKTIFNVGSVGIPTEMLNDDENDKTNKFSTLSSYMILEGNLNSETLSSLSFTLVRLPYNIEEEIKRVQACDMPNKDIIIKNLRTAIH